MDDFTMNDSSVGDSNADDSSAGGSSTDTVDIASFRTEGEAELARLCLERAGIPCMIAGSGQPGLPSGLFSAQASNVRIRVSVSDADDARDVLEEDFGSSMLG